MKIALITTLLALIVVEVFLSILNLPRPTFSLENCDYLKICGVPGSEMDERGYRNREDASTDTVVLGDSQTLGLNAKREEAWPNKLGFYNMGISGRSLAEYSLLIPQVKQLNPDRVIIAIYLGNDLLETYNATHPPKELPDLDIPRLTGNSAKSWLYDHIHLWRILAVATRPLREYVGLAEDTNDRKLALMRWANENPDKAYWAQPSTLISPYYRENAVDSTTNEVREGIHLSIKLLDKIRARLRPTELVIVLIPTKERVYQVPEYSDKEDAAAMPFLAWCLRNSVRCISPLDEMISTLRKVPIYPENFDGHPTAAGYAAIARSVSEALKKP